MAMITAPYLGDQRRTGVTPHQPSTKFLQWSRSSTIPIIFIQFPTFPVLFTVKTVTSYLTFSNGLNDL
jgi:hypothetical protein